MEEERKNLLFVFVFLTYLPVFLLKFQSGELVGCGIWFCIQRVPTMHTFHYNIWTQNSTIESDVIRHFARMCQTTITQKNADNKIFIASSNIQHKGIRFFTLLVSVIRHFRVRSSTSVNTIMLVIQTLSVGYPTGYIGFFLKKN